MRRLIAPVICLIALGLGACGDDDSPAGLGEPGVEELTTGNTAVPKCPFTAAQVTEIIGQPMKDDGNCLFGDGNGVASLTVTMASQEAGAMTYDYQREQAGMIYRAVKEIDKGGGKGYIAVKDIQAEAVVVSKAGSYTMTLSSFQRLGSTPDGYEQTLRKLLDALPL